uniref:Uncharacterized protein n=1 Tax=Arundo donax TaxID=35708 RepID=A0A0A9B5F7_ARUDO
MCLILLSGNHLSSGNGYLQKLLIYLTG